MQINLLLNSTDIRGGYINIDPYAPSDSADRTVSSVTNLDGIVDDAEATDILALDVIDFLAPQETDRTIDHWIGKVRHGGTITVGGVDLREVARSLVSQQIGMDEANLLLYGAQRAPWEYRKATLTLQSAIAALQARGLKIEKKYTHEYHFYVTARRP